MKIKVKYHNPDECKLEIFKKGEWIDLKSAEAIERPKGKFELVSLGISMQLPKEFEAIIAPRSSSFKNYGFIQTNSIGVVDSSYCGNDDVWKLPIWTLKDCQIFVGDRICQFRIQPSQKAGIWTKIKWLFTNKIEFIEVDNLESSNRGGFGSTGK